MLSAINHEVLLAVYSLADSSGLASGISIFFAEWFPFLVLASVIVTVFLKEENEGEVFRVLVRTAFPTFVVWIIVVLIKHFYPSPRPFAELELTPLISVSDPFGSFPSAHAAVFGSIAGTMLVYRIRVARWYILSAILIAIGRVAVGVHWPGDVLTGILLGLAVGFAIAKLLLRKT